MTQDIAKTTTNLNRKNFKSGGLAKIIENALNDKNNRKAFDIAFKMRKENASFQAIADQLTIEGVLTRRGKTFKKGSVKQLYDRFLKYIDEESGSFIEGEVKIESNKVTQFGNLRLSEDGEVSIEINFTPFQPLQVFSYKLYGKNEKANKEAAQTALDTIINDYKNATKKIIVSNFLHTYQITKKEFEISNEIYFSELEKIFFHKKIKYKRFINVPDSIWSMFNQDFDVLDDRPYESVIIALKLMSNAVKNHIEKCFKKEDFQLYIIRIQRDYSNFAAVDSNVLVQENYCTNSYGFSFPQSVSIHRAKEESDKDHFYRLIELKKEQLLKLYVKDEYARYPIKPIEEDEYLLIKMLTKYAEENNYLNFCNALKSTSMKIWNSPDHFKFLFERAKLVLRKVSDFTSHQRKAKENLMKNSKQANIASTTSVLY